MKRPETRKGNSPNGGVVKDGSFFSDKKNVVRLILFLIAFLTAVFFIAYGIYNMTNKKPGVHVIEAEYDYEVPVYSLGFTFEYTFEGSSNSIKETTVELKNCYSSSLRWIYKLLDADNIYGSLKNVAFINENAGKDVSVSDELYAILSDAWGKTQESEGYSVLSGPIRHFREMLVYGYDPEERDPINDETIKAILFKCEEMIYSGKAGALYFDEDKKTVRLEIDPAFSEFLDQNGVECPVLDLYLLRE
jgi:hypothetical protein